MTRCTNREPDKIDYRWQLRMSDSCGSETSLVKVSPPVLMRVAGVFGFGEPHTKYRCLAQ